MSENKDTKHFRLWRCLAAAAVFFLFIFSVFTIIRAVGFKRTRIARELTKIESENLENLLKSSYQNQYEYLKPLPYDIGKPALDIWAKSAILIDVSNGNVLYEKNADAVIPPASMTKLFAMYVVEEEVEKGNLSYDQIIPLPPESWACNMPPHSSLMFLGKGQCVTLEELLLGLSICSGNDAAYALAYTVCGSMDLFVERMNQTAKNLGLENTHFVESSGYSELNKTTAREMAKFASYYLLRFPSSIHRFHSVLDFTYPKAKNLALGDKPAAQDFSQGIPQKITMAITQENTNPLLGKLEGCDGLKTGYIDESGYNLALTAVRGETRFLSVTMGGPGRNTKEGQTGRVHDGTELMEWAFRNFTDYPLALKVHSYFVRSFNSSEKMICLVPAWNENTFTVPFIYGASMAENLESLKVEVKLPDYCWGSVEQGKQYGSIVISVGGYELQTIPLVSDRTIKRSSIFTAASDFILSRIFIIGK